MGFCLKRIEQSINVMDAKYDANFGDWIRNEDNCKIVGFNLKRYIEKYKISEFITVIKWVIKDWTLKSIILFARKLVVDDLFSVSIDGYMRRVRIVSGFIYTWNPIFISEFLLAITVEMPIDRRAGFYADVLCSFEPKKLAEILSQIEGKLDGPMKNKLMSLFGDDIYGKGANRLKYTKSIVDAFNLI
ncbi:hypothetical protein PAEPH01_0511 [Pancytospora epiphaga]|nr:hypothetical protein PAEPH01_0511 [Pancytospora epiphaga]